MVTLSAYFFWELGHQIATVFAHVALVLR